MLSNSETHGPDLSLLSPVTDEETEVQTGTTLQVTHWTMMPQEWPDSAPILPRVMPTGLL